MARLFTFLRQALTHLRRSPLLAGAALLTIGVVFLLLSVFGLLGYNLALLAESVGQNLQASVFFSDTASEAEREAVREILRRSPLVAGFEELTPAQAMARFRSRLGPDQAILEGLGEDWLPASLEIRLTAAGRDPAEMERLAQALRLPGVEDVQHGQAWLEQFDRFLRAARLGALAVGLLVLLAALVIVSNTIRLAVYDRQDEIVILKLVGASDAFVKVPFYLEGLLLGSLGSLLGVALAWLLSAVVQLEPGWLLPEGLGALALEPRNLPWEGWVALLCGGPALGVIGTRLSLGRHLRV
ncbi:MAG: cell division protein FtsX [Myxococcales bacterium]|nr:cell division protein FtsX [Myxococcales bacterium]